MSHVSRAPHPVDGSSLDAVQQVANRCGFPELTGPVREPTSWLTWLAEAFHSAPHRYRHLYTVWQRAVALRDLDLAWLEPAMSERLELAALLHDVGKALDPDDTEPHGFVGAKLLDSLGLHDIAPLVAHHSGARLEADARGMSDRDQWANNEPDLLAVLTFLDHTTSSNGEVVTLAQRRHDIAARHGESSIQIRTFDETMPDIRHAQQLLNTPNATLPGDQTNTGDGFGRASGRSAV
jgi:putative nucleotidyltransferase with HDIG domain